MLEDAWQIRITLLLAHLFPAQMIKQEPELCLLCYFWWQMNTQLVLHCSLVCVGVRYTAVLDMQINSGLIRDCTQGFVVVPTVETALHLLYMPLCICVRGHKICVVKIIAMT